MPGATPAQRSASPSCRSALRSRSSSSPDSVPERTAPAGGERHEPVQGNVNVGNDKVTLLSVVTQLLPYVGYPRALNAISCLNEVIPEPSQPGR